MSDPKTAIIIPARYASKRFPGKPLALIAGHSMIYRTWKIAKAVSDVDRVCIATDNQEIHDAARSFAAEVVMTSESCCNGTERVYQAAGKIDPRPDIIINLQADAVLTPPWVISDLVREMKSVAGPAVATAATALSKEQYSDLAALKQQGSSSGTLVVRDLKGDALYFSKSMIPFLRAAGQESPPVLRHIGIYAYRFKLLRQYLELAATPLEQAEGLEQLRLLENGIALRVIEVDYRNRTHWSVDKKQDLLQAEKIIAREGELVDL